MTIITRISHRASRRQKGIFTGGSSCAASRSSVVSKKFFSSAEIHFASRGRSLMKNHQIGSQTNGSAPSRISMVRQPYAPSSQPVTGAEATTASGWHKFQSALARARSALGNQCASKTSVAGKTQLSETPRRNRAISN